MRGRKAAARMLVGAAVLLVGLVGGGCGTTINHSYDRSTDFGALKTYAWAPGSGAKAQSRLIEENVRFLADPILVQRGFQRATGKPDFVIAIVFDSYPYAQPQSYELQMVSLYVYRSEGETLVWRGSASGSISTDAKSDDLAGAVRAILAAFPPQAGPR